MILLGHPLQQVKATSATLGVINKLAILYSQNVAMEGKYNFPWALHLLYKKQAIFLKRNVRKALSITLYRGGCPVASTLYHDQ